MCLRRLESDAQRADRFQPALSVELATCYLKARMPREAREVFEIRRGLAVGLTIMAVPRYFDLIGEDRADDEVFGVPVLRLGAGHPTIGLAIKRRLGQRSGVALGGLGTALGAAGVYLFSQLAA